MSGGVGGGKEGERGPGGGKALISLLTSWI